MTTTDSNGLIQYQTTDNVVPLQTTLNAISSSVSTSLNSTVRTFKVANDTERNALATTRVPSATNPLIVFNSASGKGYHEINTGSGWSKMIPGDMGWRNAGGTLGPGVSQNTPVQYRILGDVVYWRGQVYRSGNWQSGVNTVITGVEQEARPSTDMPITVSHDIGNFSAFMGADGTMRLYSVDSASSAWPIIGGSYPLG